MRENSQSKKWMITINNPSEAGIDAQVIKNILSDVTLRYYAFVMEIGNEGHTPHYHIFVLSDSPTYFSMWKRRFPIAHLDKAYGKPSECLAYIKKTGKWADTDKAETTVPNTFEEWGDLPEDAKEDESWQEQVMKWIEEGETTSEIIRHNPKKLAFKTKDIDILRQTMLSDKYMKENRDDLEVYYIYGETGTGKSYSVMSKYGTDCCRITNYSGDKVNFDSYTNQSVLCFDEYRNQLPMSAILNLTDIYPTFLPARYSDKVACYRKVYFLSNWEFEKQYEYERKNSISTYRAWLRRITKIYEQIAPDVLIEKNKEEYMI